MILTPIKPELYYSLFKKAALFLPFILLCNTNIYSEGVKVLGSPRKDAILLRWAPMSPAVWRLGNEYGYLVERFTILRDGEIPDDISGEILADKPFLPMEQAAWELLMDDDKYVSIAAECIFSSTFKGLDSGGNPHMVYKMYKEEQQRFSFALYAADQSLDAARLSGLYFEDKSARENEKYLYRVYISCPDTLAVDTGFVFTGLSEYQALPKPQTPVAKWGDKQVELSWDIRHLNHIYNSYVVERSEDGGHVFERISDNALVQLSDEGVNPDYMYRSDTLANNGVVYYYRIRGISAFGEPGPSSDSIFGRGRLPLTQAPVFIGKEVIDNKKVKLSWEYPDRMDAFVTGFKLYRSSGPKSRKEVIFEGVEPSQRSFIDDSPDMTNYYLVSAYNQDEEKVSLIETYAARVDSFPPVAPQGLTGSIDSLGIVSISWLPNTESDLEGYRVFTSNHPAYEFILRTPLAIPDTAFMDSINIHTLTRSIFYKVAAIDVRQNQSVLSDVLELKRPDVIPPVAPRLLELSESKKGVFLEWIPSSSTDVSLHHIYRKGERESSFVSISSLSDKGEIMKYTDPTVNPGLGYDYYIVAEDEGGLMSPASNRRYIRAGKDKPEELRLRYTKQLSQIVLEWDIVSAKRVERVVVYRGEGDGVMRLYGNSENDSFPDQKLSPGITYYYRAKAVYEDGSSSPVSEIVKVKL